MLAEALDVEQVVEVITEVGRTAMALRSAVALLDEERLRLRVVNPDGLAPVGPDSADVRLTLEHAERDDPRDRERGARCSSPAPRSCAGS